MSRLRTAAGATGWGAAVVTLAMAVLDHQGQREERSALERMHTADMAAMQQTVERISGQWFELAKVRGCAWYPSGWMLAEGSP